MVYLGPSRGCITCKRRRKKCDETRPSCLRCLNTNRCCEGYQPGGNLIFRQHEAKHPSPSVLPVQSMARKCSLPPRVSTSEIDGLPQDAKLKEVPTCLAQEFALRAFFHDYSITPVNSLFSRGFLSGLEPMVRRQGFQSQVAKACKAVAFACHGLKLNRPFITRMGEELYHDLLNTLAHAIKDPKLAKKADTVATAILLGLYEMIMADGTDLRYHRAHAGGLAALLQIEARPLALLEAVRSGRLLLASAPQTFGIFSSPYTYGRTDDLDSLMLRLGQVCKDSHALLSEASTATDTDKLVALREDAQALNHNIAQWQLSQGDEYKPTTIGHITPDSDQTSPEVGFWPGAVDVYFDFYVATVWNASRLGRCLLLDLIAQLSDLLNDDQTQVQTQQDMLRQIEETIASIPYHFAEDVRSFVRCAHAEKQISVPERATGGLLLMHPIYTLSTLQTVPPEMQKYMRNCLSWIGTHMGIGQASLLAQSKDIGQDYITSGCMIVWAGLLF